MKKTFWIVFVVTMIILYAGLPCLAEERMVVGINTVIPGIFSLEFENARNDSWIIGGMLFGAAADSFYMDVYGGRKFYNGDRAGRPYAGFYGNFRATQDFFITSGTQSSVALFGIYGYEWRFGKMRNTRFFLEGEMNLRYELSRGVLSYSPMVAAGFGFNL